MPNQRRIYKTRFPALGIEKQGPLNWRYVDLSTGAATGGPRASKEEAFADLAEFAKQWGCVNA